MTLSTTAYLEKNKLATTHAWIILLEITLIDLITIIRICTNSEDVTWPVIAGDVWTAFPFQIGEIGDSSKGEVPRVSVKVGNVSRVMEPYMDTYDGLVNSSVKIYVVNSKNVTTSALGTGVNNSNPELELDYEIIESNSDAQWANFILGASNPFNKRFPRNRIMRNVCRYKVFKGEQCKYVGPVTTCDRTLETCRGLNNAVNFGGRPGVGSKGIYV